MTSALLLIDIQHDFLEGGALAVPLANAIIPIANAMMDRFDTVIATQDWHPAGHGSFASTHNKPQYEVIDLHGLPQVLWPDHCVQGTHGAEFHPDLNTARFDRIIQKGSDPTVDSYSGFADNGGRIETELDDHLKAQGIETLYVCGLATDYCGLLCVLAKEPWPAGCQSCVAITISNLSIIAFAMGMISFARGTANAPPSKKSC